MDCNLPGSSVHEDSPSRILEWVAMPSSRESYQWGSNLGILHCRQILYQLGHQGSPFEKWKEENGEVISKYIFTYTQIHTYIYKYIIHIDIDKWGSAPYL